SAEGGRRHPQIARRPHALSSRSTGTAARNGTRDGTLCGARRQRRHPMTETVRTRVAIVGAGPAGLMLAHLLAADGIDSVVIDSRSRDEIERTIRAGILEQSTVELLESSGASDRVRTVGARHDGVELRFDGEGHRIDFAGLTGRAVWLYPQHEVLKDL